ncbi:MAG: DUF4862 family protein [Bifidobacteriaceae bacterium]|nr:DUF4862 family protein [Bifidobacteriaceae bacterium]
MTAMSQRQAVKGVVVGAYAATPGSLKGEWSGQEEYLRAVLDLEGVAGLEMPWFQTDFLPDEEGAIELLKERGRHVITLVAGTMAKASASGGTYGLASDSAEGRKAALRDMRHVRDVVAEVTGSGNGRVIGVEIQSAPHPLMSAFSPQYDPTSAVRFAAQCYADSVAEIASWDWSGARLLLEHCDSAFGKSPQKGLLPLDDEIEIARSQVVSPTNVSVAINWGRSALEGHRAGLATEQIESAERAGVLGSVFLSGTADHETVYGPAWADTHTPFVIPGVADDPDSPVITTLLDSPRLRASLAACERAGAILGLKVQSPPEFGQKEVLEELREHLARLR